MISAGATAIDASRDFEPIKLGHVAKGHHDLDLPAVAYVRSSRRTCAEGFIWTTRIHFGDNSYSCARVVELSAYGGWVDQDSGTSKPRLGPMAHHQLRRHQTIA
jgi:hypothetical protein